MRLRVLALASTLLLTACGETGLHSFSQGNPHLVVEKWSCERGEEVRIRVDGKLQSDVHGLESVTPVTGELVATIDE